MTRGKESYLSENPQWESGKSPASNRPNQRSRVSCEIKEEGYELREIVLHFSVLANTHAAKSQERAFSSKPICSWLEMYLQER